jgi:mono/diheme cytochrome c family protein
MCHRANGMGTGLLSRRLPPEQAQLEARDNLTADYVNAVVRRGLVNMPPLSRAEVSDEALDAIAAYLEAGPHAPEPSP